MHLSPVRATKCRRADPDDLERGGIRSRNRFPGGPGRGPGRVERDLSVPGNSRGVDAGIDVRSGDQITFTGSGTIVAGQRAGTVGPGGGRSTGFGSIVGTRPVPSAGVGALIGFLRMADGQNSQPFFIGSSLTWTAPADGRLYLLVNDDNYNDNSGAFSVHITLNRSRLCGGNRPSRRVLLAIKTKTPFAKGAAFFL